MRADRLLSILLLLQIHGRLTARELAQRLECSERTILRDMDALSAAGVPVVADRGAAGGWRLVGGYQTKLTGLTAAEVQALFVTVPARLLADLGLKDDADAALLKLQASLPPAGQRHAELARQRIWIDTRGWRDPGDAIAALPALLDAVWRDRRVRFVYDSALGEAGGRIADPLGLVAKGSAWYLIAQVDAVVKTYRVSRIREPLVLDEPSARPADFDLQRYWEQSTIEFRDKLPRYYATFLVQPSVLRWARYRGWRLEEETPEAGGVRLRLRFDAEEEALQFALSFGDSLEVVEPDDLRTATAQAAAAVAARYRTTSAARAAT